MLEDVFGFLIETIVGLWNNLVRAYMFVFGWIY